MGLMTIALLPTNQVLCLVTSLFYLFIFIFLLAGCYPYYDKDPFILDRCPHVYFSGNQPSFQHKKVQGKQANAS